MSERDIVKIIKESKRIKHKKEFKVARYFVLFGLSLFLGTIFTEIIQANIDTIIKFMNRLEDSYFYIFLGSFFIVTGITSLNHYDDKLKTLKRASEESLKSNRFTTIIKKNIEYSFYRYKKIYKSAGSYIFLMAIFMNYMGASETYKVLILTKKNSSVFLHSVVLFFILSILWNFFESIMKVIKDIVPDSKDRLSIIITIIATVVSAIALLK
ncbi:hypothetical protein J14TS2_17380 [Bacillus sp. J14TS2]|uniref:hypothetical protein n=1 Tax=Bacillus sp. J14TS2 TaxID=2807188 RepID=UPI001B22D4A7|nr:hypothetical protein [Bacillus sp. J14TS2]GIN71263.1 hypothetical protein J14TS2_17380 [Bacillus sp. J14TS2]